MNLSQRKIANEHGAEMPADFQSESEVVTSRTNVSFPIEGITCRAWLYEPDVQVARPAPCIVMAHGLGGTRAASLEPYAERFAAAGFFVLLFDYRYLGASDGEPRQLVSIRRQLADWRAAVSFARKLPGVDPQRIGLWGTSLSGGHVVVLASRDKEIGAVSAQCPMLDGMASAELATARTGIRGTLRMARAALHDIVRSLFGRAPYYVPLVAGDGQLAAMASDRSYAGWLRIVPANARNEIAARILLSLPLYKPLRRAQQVSCPTLLIVCANDTVVSAKAAADAASRMKNGRAVSFPIDHFDIYKGPWFDRACAEQVAFFCTALRVRQAKPYG
ncbi:MAG: alpha/beta fold hydrolase [Hyphomicrobium sp.]|jgi:dienelactone hydrolase